MQPMVQPTEHIVSPSIGADRRWVDLELRDRSIQIEEHGVDRQLDPRRASEEKWLNLLH